MSSLAQGQFTQQISCLSNGTVQDVEILLCNVTYQNLVGRATHLKNSLTLLVVVLLVAVASVVRTKIYSNILESKVLRNCGKLSKRYSAGLVSRTVLEFLSRLVIVD